MAFKTIPIGGYTLLNGPSGTALNGSATITVGNIGGYNKYFIYVSGASSANLSAQIRFRINEDSNLRYNYAGPGILGTAATAVGVTSDSVFLLGRMGNLATDTVTAFVTIDGANAAGIMPIVSSSQSSGSTTNGSYAFTGFYSAVAPLSSISIVTSAGNLDAGTLFVYGQ